VPDTTPAVDLIAINGGEPASSAPSARRCVGRPIITIDVRQHLTDDNKPVVVVLRDGCGPILPIFIALPGV
jgi:hypothetical protein